MQKHFKQAKTSKTLEKIHANQNENKKKNQKIQPLTLLYTIFHEKGTPFVYLLSVINGATSTYPV